MGSREKCTGGLGWPGRGIQGERGQQGVKRRAWVRAVGQEDMSGLGLLDQHGPKGGRDVPGTVSSPEK